MMKINLMRQSQAEQLLAELKSLYSSLPVQSKAVVKAAVRSN